MDGHGTGSAARPKKAESHLQPPLNIVDGKPVVEKVGLLAGLLRFLAEPFTSAWHHRDLIVAILRRELRERFKGSAAGWVWAVTAPLLSLITYTVAFGGSAKLRACENVSTRAR